MSAVKQMLHEVQRTTHTRRDLEREREEMERAMLEEEMDHERNGNHRQPC